MLVAVLALLRVANGDPTGPDGQPLNQQHMTDDQLLENIRTLRNLVAEVHICLHAAIS